MTAVVEPVGTVRVLLISAFNARVSLPGRVIPKSYFI